MYDECRNMVSSTNKPDRHDIAEILLKVALNTINQPSTMNLHNELYYVTQIGVAIKSAILHTIPEGHGYHFGPDKHKFD
jgi:hypothetical protein